MNWRYEILKIIWTPRGGSALPRDSIHAYSDYNIQIYSSPKPLDQSKSNFIGSICMKGESMHL